MAVCVAWKTPQNQWRNPLTIFTKNFKGLKKFCDSVFVDKRMSFRVLFRFSNEASLA